MVSFPTEDLLELAYAAYRVNNGHVKNTTWDSSNDRTIYSNRDLVYYSAMARNTVSAYIPSGCESLTVTDEDRENVKIAQKHFRRYSFLILGTDLTDFQKTVFSAISKEETDSRHVGIVAAVPTVVKNEIETIAYMRRLKTEFGESKHYTQKEVSGVSEILKRAYLKDYEIYLYFAGMDGNLVSFTKKEKHEIGSTYQLRARVKSAEIERDTKLPLTKLNYVKLSLVEIEDAV